MQKLLLAIILICGTTLNYSAIARIEENRKLEFWRSAPRGVNISSTNSPNDFKAAKKYGVRLVRIGATGSPGDLRYLVPPGEGLPESWDLTPEKLEKLKTSIRNASDSGLSVVITLAHIPGRAWEYRARDFRIWKDKKYRVQFVEAWKKIALALRDLDAVVGYDILNEPYLPKEEPETHLFLLQKLYEDTAASIRSVDKRTPIILESAEMASASALSQLKPVQDPNTLYSFHYYEPYPFFSPPLNQAKLNYPGMIPLEENGVAIF